jgi:hypothetical protein
MACFLTVFVGTTHQARSELLLQFKKIYGVRSQIVHSGKHKLTSEERELCISLEWMCRRAISKEMENHIDDIYDKHDKVFKERDQIEKRLNALLEEIDESFGDHMISSPLSNRGLRKPM